jgi:uncharacterized protein
MKVAILGSSPNTQRYSYKADVMLREYKHETFLVSPRYDEIEGVKTHKDLSQLTDIDTLTMYVAPKISAEMGAEIMKLAPRRVIFNPGTENAQLEAKLEKAGIIVEQACTLVMLKTSQFD